MARDASALVIACFQKERFYRQEAHRYRRIAKKSDQVYVLSAPETDFTNHSGLYETIAFDDHDALAQEWHLVVVGPTFSSCLVCGERINVDHITPEENSRRFEGIWTFDRQVAVLAAQILLERVVAYRPELKAKVAIAQEKFLATAIDPQAPSPPEIRESNPDPFVQRLISYLQASQYKLLKANAHLANKEHKERLINSVTSAIRRSLDSEKILQLAVEKLGEGLDVCRCIIYRCQENDETATIDHEFLNRDSISIKGSRWPLRHNPLFQEVVALGESLSVDNADALPLNEQDQQEQKKILNLAASCSIHSWLLVPVLYQGKLLGMVELHHCNPNPHHWKEEDISLVNAIATQVGVALIQAEAYANLEDLNQQLEALDRTRSNLVAITGHELRTPLSTIQVCLESLASEPDMPPEMRDVMLSTALEDAERMRKLVKDFLTLSQLESGRVQWNPETISLAECVELAISNIKAQRKNQGEFPTIINRVAFDYPLVQADGEWLVEVLAKLLDNACKFTNGQDQITIDIKEKNPRTIQVNVTDTGRGIEPSRLENVFERFYQEEGALRRSAGGTGLGLAICRQIVSGWGGEIWAESEGKDQGSQFSFTIPLFLGV